MTPGTAQSATPRKYVGHGIEGEVYANGFLMADVNAVLASARRQGWAYDPISADQHVKMKRILDQARSDSRSAGAIMTRRAYADDWRLQRKTRRSERALEVRCDPRFYPFIDMLDTATEKLRSAAPLTRIELRGLSSLVHSTLVFKPRPTKFDDEAY